MGLDPSKRISQFAHTAWRLQDGAFSGAPNAIAQTRDGYLWIGTDGGLVRFDGVHFVPWSPPGGKHLSDPRTISLLGARDGTLWIGTAIGPFHWTGEDLVQFPKVKGRVNSLLEDKNGTVWLSRSRIHDGSGPLCGARRIRSGVTQVAMAFQCPMPGRWRWMQTDISGWAVKVPFPDGSLAPIKALFPRDSKERKT